MDNIRGWTLDEQDQWREHPEGPEEFHSCIGIVDGTYIRVERPKEYTMERRLYSIYKKYHSVFFLCIIDRYGSFLQAQVDEHDCCSSLYAYLFQVASASSITETRLWDAQRTSHSTSVARGCDPD